ncbi:WxL domain-containing protein [Enterococcus faecalis]|nr:WxL domain-containing protein [Enterococcus faecalis]MDN3200237.1 WxL domain-containing protein [Enterococcus faecalis]
MKQIRFKHLATLGVCCSLFSNSLAGVTAVAETMTIESRPTAESTQVEEEEKTEETETQESLLKTAEQKEMSNSLIGSSRAIANFAFPERVAKFQFVDENGNLLNPSLFELTSDFALRTNGSLYNPVHYAGTDVGTTKQIIFPQTSIVTENSPSNPVFVGATDSQVVIPRFAESISVVPPTNYTGNTYVQPNVEQYNRSGSNWVLNATYTTEKLNVHKKDASTYGIGAAPPFLGLLPIESNASGLYYVAATSTTSYLNRLFSVSGVTTLYVTNRKVTEFFKNQAGATIPTPPNFEEGRKTSITNNNYTFKQSGTLPDTYTSGGKTYKFKGWYKGKTKPATLETSKTPSYAVTYDDNDDLNVVYEEIEAFDFPAITYQFGFLDESGKRVDASTIGMTYDNWYGEVLGTNVADWKTINIEKGQVAPTKNNLKEIVYPAQSLEIMSGRNSQYSAANLTFALPKYYEKMSVYNKNGTFDAAYPIPSVQNNNSTNPIVEGTDKTVSKWFELKKSGSQSFILNQTITAASTDVQVPGYLREVVHNPTTTTATKGTYYTLDKPVYYYLTNRKVTENFVDASGAKITPPTGFTQGKQTVIDSDPYTFKQSGTLPDTYKAGGKTYKFKGWYKGKTKPATLETTKTPSYAVTYDDKDDMTAVYEEVQPTAEMTVSRLLEVIPNEASMVWTVRLKNTSEVPLTNVKLAPTAKWAAGISAPTQLAVRISNTPNKIIPVTAEQWRTGVNLGVEIPVNGEALVTVNTAKITGEPRQLLTAEMTASGNFSAVTASNFVRIQGEDQTITPTPTEEGFISTPTFDFGKITISSSVKQYGLKKAADYYGNGTRNPYLRIKKSQPNWQLTAQLSQLKASTDSLPTSTRLLLGNANVAAIENYNQVTELTNKVGVTKALTLTSDGTSTPVILNNQFTGNDVYQLDFDFASVKLEVPANQGKINEKYQGTVTWNLVTGP